MKAPCLTRLLSVPCLLCGISGPSACSCGILRPWLPQPALRAAGAEKSISKSQVVMPAMIRCPLQLMLFLLTIGCFCAANMFNLGFPPATAAKVYSPQELTKDLAKYHSSKTYTKKPAEEPDEDETKPSADYCGGKGGPLCRGECISNLVLGEIYRLRQLTHKSTVKRARHEDTVAAHLIATAQPSHCSCKEKQATSRAKLSSKTHHSQIFSLNKKYTHTICPRDGIKKKIKSLVQNLTATESEEEHTCASEVK